MSIWEQLQAEPVGAVGLVLFVLLFPVYHALLPWTLARFSRFASGKRFEREVRSWIRSMLDRDQIIVGVQQTRNVTMVSSLLASSTLLLMALAANFMIQTAFDERLEQIRINLVALKLLILFAMLTVSFVSFVAALSRCGKFTISLGIQRDMLDRLEGDAVDYLASLFLAAVLRYRFGIRFLHGMFPLVFWMLSPWLFVATTLFLALRFILFEDFPYAVRKRGRPDRRDPAPLRKRADSPPVA